MLRFGGAAPVQTFIRLLSNGGTTTTTNNTGAVSKLGPPLKLDLLKQKVSKGPCGIGRLPIIKPVPKEEESLKVKGPKLPALPGLAPPKANGKGLAMPISTALKKIKVQDPNLYAKLLVHNFPFTVVQTDLLVTHRMKDVQVGDIITLDNVREVGSTDYKLCGRPVLPKGSVSVTATIMEHTHGAKVRARMRKQRKGRRPLKTIKPPVTILRVQKIHVNPDFQSTPK